MRKGPAEANGMGMSITRVEMLGGKILVADTPRGGARFHAGPPSARSAQE